MSGISHLDELAKKLFSILPDNFQQLEQDIQQQFKTILQTTFHKLNLVTREEFDVQTRVLARTREKLTVLEAQVAQLIEQKIKNTDN